jgi:Replication-relaxation
MATAWPWHPERWVRTTTAEVKPDGFGRYLHPSGACEFNLEYDRGTEALDALSRKLEGYLRLEAGWTEEQEPTGFPNLLIVVLEGCARGRSARPCDAVGRLHVPESIAASFPLYVAGEDALSQHRRARADVEPSARGSRRLSLLELPARPRGLHRGTQCFGRNFTDGVRDRRRRISPASTPPRFAVLPPPLPP